MTGAVYAGILTVGIASIMPHPRGEEPGTGWYGFFVAVPVFAIALILIIPILRNRARGEVQRMCLSIVGFIYIGWMFGHLGFLRQRHERVRLSLFHHFRDRVERRGGVHFRQNIRTPSTSE